MARIQFFYSLLFISLYSWESVNIQTQEKIINEVKQQPLANLLVEIYQATYNSIFVYHIKAPYSDMHTTLIDENCKTISQICKVDLKRRNIVERTMASKLIWKDQRKSKN